MNDTGPGRGTRRPPSRRGYVVAVVVAVASIAVAAGLVAWIVKAASDYGLTPMRQGDSITVSEGRKALFAELEPGADPADNYFCVVTQGDEWEYARKSGSMQINQWSRVGVTPEGLAPGEYVVTCSGLAVATPMAVGDQPNVAGNVARGILAGVIGFGGCLVALLLLIITAVRRSEAKRPPRRTPLRPQGPPGPPAPRPGPTRPRP
ncbi:MAG: hypothetical protein ACTH2Q_03630 [Propionibacteriaceae bacterium]